MTKCKKKKRKVEHEEEEKDPTLVLGKIRIDWVGLQFPLPEK